MFSYSSNQNRYVIAKFFSRTSVTRNRVVLHSLSGPLSSVYGRFRSIQLRIFKLFIFCFETPKNLHLDPRPSFFAPIKIEFVEETVQFEAKVRLLGRWRGRYYLLLPNKVAPVDRRIARRFIFNDYSNVKVTLLAGASSILARLTNSYVPDQISWDFPEVTDVSKGGISLRAKNLSRTATFSCGEVFKNVGFKWKIDDETEEVWSQLELRRAVFIDQEERNRDGHRRVVRTCQLGFEFVGLGGKSQKNMLRLLELMSEMKKE